MQRLLMNVFLSLLTLTGQPLIAQDSQGNSKARTTTVLTVGGKVFVSCEVKIDTIMNGGITFTLKDGVAHIVRDSSVPKKTEEATVQLTSEEMHRFMRLIERAHFFTLKSGYRQKSLFDGGWETTTLTVRSNGKERVYSVLVHGNTAPKSYYEFSVAVRAFENEHLPYKSDR
jgi:hypothetical protein